MGFNSGFKGLNRRCDRFELYNRCQPTNSAETWLFRYCSRIETWGGGGGDCELPAHVMNETLYSTDVSPVITACWTKNCLPHSTFVW